MKPISKLGLFVQEINGHLYLYRNNDNNTFKVVWHTEHNTASSILGPDKTLIASTEKRHGIIHLVIENTKHINATELLIKTDLIDYKIKKDKNGDWIPYDEEYTLKIRNNKVNARWN
jgi:hypothetical protein